MENLKSAFERFFRLFHKFCIQPDLDTLFNLMNSIHSLNDRLNNSASQNFFKSREFISIKALRNLFHHQDELLNELRIIPADRLPPITTDLLFLCLVPAHLVEASFEHIPKKYRDEQEAIIRSTLKWYREVVNIYPCIFNFSVQVFEKVQDIELELDCPEYMEFKTSYNFETENGHSHFVNGNIGCLAGNVDEVLRVAFANIA